MSRSRAVEVHQFVLEFLTDRLRDHLRQLQVVDLLLPDNIELGTLGSAEISLVLVVLRKVDDEHQTVSNILGVDVSPGPGLCLGGVCVNNDLGLHSTETESQHLIKRQTSFPSMTELTTFGMNLEGSCLSPNTFIVWTTTIGIL